MSSNFFLKNRRKKLPTSKPRNDLHDSPQYKISQDKLAPLIVRLSFGLVSVSAFVKVKMKTNTESAMLSKSAAKKLKKKLQSACTATKRKPIKATNAVVSAVPDLNLETLWKRIKDCSQRTSRRWIKCISCFKLRPWIWGTLKKQKQVFVNKKVLCIDYLLKMYGKNMPFSKTCSIFCANSMIWYLGVLNTRCEEENCEADIGQFLRPGLDKIWSVGLVCFQLLSCLVGRITLSGFQLFLTFGLKATLAKKKIQFADDFKWLGWCSTFKDTDFTVKMSDFQ